MSKIKESDMQPEYDFSKGVRGKHYRAYQEGTNLVLLEPDIAKVFKDSEIDGLLGVEHIPNSDRKSDE